MIRKRGVEDGCKGHPGLSSYPTKVGNQAPGFVGDPLRVWRQVTAERGVALYMHYSGVWDSEAIRRHPDWAAVERRRQAEPQRHVVLLALRRAAADPATPRAGRRLRRGRRLGGRRVLGLRAGLRRRGAEGLPRGDGHSGRPPQARRSALARVPGVQPRRLPQLPAATTFAEVKNDPSGDAAVQQLGVHRPHARDGLRAGGLDLRRLTRRRTASTPPGSRPATWRSRASRGT